MPATPTDTDLQIDIVSDVMCPWCIVAWKQLEAALAALKIQVTPRWHPFELNPEMPPEGQNLAEHIAQKYGSTPAQGAQNRARLAALGQTLGFTFAFDEGSRIRNTFAAHQLLDWAEDQGKQHALKLALFTAHFTDARDISDPAVLTATAASAGLDPAAAAAVLRSGAHAKAVRDKQAFWSARGITAVPAVVVQGKYLMSGAQGTPAYAEMLKTILTEAVAP